MSTPYHAMPSRPMRSLFSMPILACAFALIVSPMMIFFTSTPSAVKGVMETRYENKLFWPTMAVIAIVMAAQNYRALGRALSAPHILSLMAYLAFAAASVLWAFSPELSLIRFIQQAMIVVAVLIPGVLAARSVDLMRGLFLCFALAVVLNIFFVAEGYQTLADKEAIGYSGFFQGKNYLGECTAVAVLLSLHELCRPGLRRVGGAIILAVSVFLMLYANSKTALALALVAPAIAGIILIPWRVARISPAVVVWSLVLAYFIFAQLTGFSMNRLSYMLFGDSSLTGRQIIWDYTSLEMAHKPLLGWGYQSFWLVGPDGPSVVNAPGWVKTMPNAHNGYYDTMLEMGYVGIALLLTFITTMLHGVRWIAERDMARAWAAVSIMVFVMMHTGLESTWMRGFEFLWIVFLIVAVDIARYRPPLRTAVRPGAPYRHPAVGGRHGEWASGPRRQALG
jgi:exopolysaccharide production protein ExoQ